ncbi:MAG: histidinol dehydrogenase, partial [Proteobacteria bacterium]|nr:histidinol dehydrogenase [Pseudomonadota bacterium]
MSEITITELDAKSPDFAAQLQSLLAWNEADDLDIHRQVLDIIADVRGNGDKSVIAYTNRFDNRQVSSATELELDQASLKSAFAAIPADQAQALQTAAGRIRAYAEHQKLQSWDYIEADGTVLGQKITPLDRVGLYVPGGKAAYPSS